jgi:hypothetical protein
VTAAIAICPLIYLNKYKYKTNPENIDFIQLISELDKDIKIRDGEEHSDQFNKTDSIKHAIVAYDCGKAVAVVL